MKDKTQIHAADLYVLMQREFRRRQSPECTACYVQLPFRVDRIEPEAPNWEVRFASSCSHGCRALIEDLVNEFGALYDLRPDNGSRN